MKKLEIKKAKVDYDEIDAGTSVIEEEMYEQLDIDLETYQNILESLLSLIKYRR